MGLTTERKVFLAILGVAGVSLIIDRGVLAPSNAAATTDGVGVSMDQPAEPDGVQGATESAVVASVNTARLLMERLGEGEDDPDGLPALSSAFTLQQEVPSTPEPVEVGVEPGADAGLAVITPRVADLPELSSVMPSSNGGGAVLGGRLVRVGQRTPGGFVLLEVRERAVVLERDGVRYAVRLPVSGRP